MKKIIFFFWLIFVGISSASAGQGLVSQSLPVGVSIGAAFALVLVFAMVLLANKSRLTALLLGYFFLQACLCLVISGVNLGSVLPQYLVLQQVELVWLISLSSIVLLWLSSELFKLFSLDEQLHRIYYLASWCILVSPVLSMFLTLNDNLLICYLVQLATTILLFSLCRNLFVIRHSLAGFFTLFVATQASFLVINVTFFDWYEFNAALYLVTYGLSSLVLVYLLSYQSALQLKEKHQAQREAMESALEARTAHQELVALQEEVQEQLESKVQERTFELNIALQELEEANRELEQKNTLDELTGLYNRRYYDQKLLAEFRRSRRNLTPLSLVVIDIDFFKKVNDNYGHSSGDKCLIGLAKLVKEALHRSSDVGCRYGGEEFCLILPETDQAGATALADQLRQKVENQLFDIGSGSINLTISCGVSTYQQQDGVKIVDIFNAADKALYRAKAQGRNQVQSEAVLAFDVSAL